MTRRRRKVPDDAIKPQPGPQERFLASRADVAIYGGAAFGGKTFALLMEAARHQGRRGMDAVIFRRTYPQITASGGLWDTSEDMFRRIGGTPKLGNLTWEWPTGHRVMLRHLQHEKDKYSYQGAAIPLLCFDELTHFSRGQFFYLLSRNRMYAGAPGKPYVRATCNPAADSWVAEFLSWWIGPDGLPIPERAGVVRWFGRDGDAVVWGDTPDELAKLGVERPKSATFIPAKITDNRIGLERDPDYEANLRALAMFEREQLLHGNWKVRPIAGMFFRRAWFGFYDPDHPPVGRTIRYWDRAATEVSPATPDPDWTVGLKATEHGGRIYLRDLVRVRMRPEGVIATVSAAAQADGPDCEQWLEQDPGQAGKTERLLYQDALRDYQCRFVPPRGSKLRRALPASALAEAGRIMLPRGAPWVNTLLAELESFADYERLPKDERPPTLPHDDQVDSLSGVTFVLTSAGAATIRGGVEP